VGEAVADRNVFFTATGEVGEELGEGVVEFEEFAFPEPGDGGGGLGFTGGEPGAGGVVGEEAAGLGFGEDGVGDDLAVQGDVEGGAEVEAVL
jgi:hypothetical protein